MKFTYAYLEEQLRGLQAAGYGLVPCCAAFKEFRAAGAVRGGAKTVILRVDVDLSLARARRLGTIFDRLGVKGTFFVRLHAKEYNPFDFENFRCLKALQASGHEIGYHSEIVDQAAIWGEGPASCLARDIAVMSAMLGQPVTAVASHGGLTGLNNLDFWQDHTAEELGLEYEAYQDGVFEASRYVSDSEWTQWKSYQQGKRMEGDMRSPLEHAIDGMPLIYLLIHPDTYFDHHIYED